MAKRTTSSNLETRSAVPGTGTRRDSELASVWREVTPLLTTMLCTALVMAAVILWNASPGLGQMLA